MASGTLHHFGFALFHLEYFRMAVSTFKLMLGDMGLMAKRYRPRTSSRFKFDVASPYFFLLGVVHADGNQTENTNTDDRGFATSLPQVLTPSPVDDLT